MHYRIVKKYKNTNLKTKCDLVLEFVFLYLYLECEDCSNS